MPPVFPRLHGEVYPPRGGALSCTSVVSRVRAAINRCEHAPEYTADSTIKQKVLAALAKDGRQDNAAAFETFDAYQFVMATAAEPVDEASQQPQPVTAAAPVADAPPSISAFRAAGKSESAAQAEYRCAMHGFHDARRSVERAAEARKRRALEASIAQTLAAEAAWERRMERYHAEQKEHVAEVVRRTCGPDATWCVRRPARAHRPPTDGTELHPLRGRRDHFVAMVAYAVQYPPCEVVHARRLQESAEEMADLLTAHAHASDAKVARSDFAIRVALCATALARTRPANIELLGSVLRAWQTHVKTTAAERAMAKQRAQQRFAQQQQLDE